MRTVYYIFLLILSYILSACHLTIMDCHDGSGEIIKEERSVGKFDRIKANGEFDLYLYQSDSNSVIVEIDDNLTKYIRVSVVDNELEIDEVKTLCTKIKKIYITSPRFKKLEINGSSKVHFRNSIKTNYIELASNGAADIIFEDLDSPNLKAELSGAGNLTIKKGKGGNFHLITSGAGNTNALDFPSDSIKVEISGAGEAIVNAKKFLLIKIFGAGDVKFKSTDSTTVIRRVLGAGDIQKIK